MLVYIDPGANITFKNSRLWSDCGNTWTGLSLLTSGSSTGQLHLGANTLIENADTAAVIRNAIAPGSGYVFTSDSAIFNKDSIGVFIMNFNTTASSYPFRVRSTVFTCRNNIALTYNSWSTNTALKTITGTNGYSSPYSLTYNYSGSTPFGGNRTFAGILLDSIGHTTFGGSVPVYYDLTIGDVAQAYDLNLFDNLRNGIYCYNANLTSLNNAYSNCGDGIYSTTNLYLVQVLQQPQPFHARLRLYNAGGNYNNRFYDCINGVEASNFYELDGLQTYMISNHNTSTITQSTLTTPGSYGYKLNSWNIYNLIVSQDTITNITYGVSHVSTNSPAQVDHQITINNNLIQATPNNVSYYMTQHPNRYVSTAISLQNTINPYYLPIASTVAVNSDTVLNAYRGVYVSNWQKGTPYSTQNTIRTPAKDTLHGTQYGIWHVSNRFDSVWNNAVYGTDSTVNHTDSIRGIYSSWNFGTRTYCNQVDSLNRAFEFAGTNTGTKWITNRMSGDGWGLTLNFNGVIDTQYYKSHDSAIGVMWTSVAPWWTGSNNYQTYTLGGSKAIFSPLYVNSGTTTMPTNNWGYPITYRYTASTLYTTASIPYTCPSIPPVGKAHGITEIGPFEDVAENVIPYGQNNAISQWMAQYALWQALSADSTLADSSAILQEFRTNAANSRFGYLTNIENDLASGDLSDAQSLLDIAFAGELYANPSIDLSTGVVIADSSGGPDSVVNNYLNFYNVYLDYANGVLGSSDSMEVSLLAALCPHTNGTVVYQARALYAIIFNDLGVWDDDSTCSPYFNDTTVGKDGGMGRKTKGGTQSISASQQKYTLSPNPNTGHMILLQTLTDNGPVSVEILNAQGQAIYQAQLQFAGKTAKLQVHGLVPGLYLLELRDSSGKRFILKFVVTE